MRPIPKKLVTEMESDPFYKKCCITGQTGGKIDWHHNLIFAKRQVNEKWCILPLSEEVHERIIAYKEKCNWIMLNRGSDEEIRRVSKAIDYFAMRDRLNKKFGTYIPQ